MSKFAHPEHSKGRVNRAGNNVRADQYDDDDIAVIENWRASHSYILNTFQATLRGRSRGHDVVVAQRLKRRNTIFNKLSRQEGMQLARMHDIAGCRLIFNTAEDLYRFRSSLHAARFKHVLRNGVDDYDYIKTPKATGYRGVHDVYQYNVLSVGGEKWNGLLLELQYRTIYQHAWATSVEVAGLITEHQPKFNNGDERHLHFFRLASEIIARVYEASRSCLPDLTDQQVVAEFREIEAQINLLRTLKGINTINKEVTEGKNAILIFSEDTGALDVKTFNSAPLAIMKYFELEKSSVGKDIVLVRADSSEDIRFAFRNYFSDTNDFVRLVEEGCERLSP